MGPMTAKNHEFELRGVNHLALVCRDMERTVDFYCNVLGMPLVKTIDLPFGSGQHFFFDMGNGDSLASRFPTRTCRGRGFAARCRAPRSRSPRRWHP